MEYLPIAIRLKDKKALVVGGGKVALRKVKALINAGAYVHVIAPTLCRQLSGLRAKGRINWTARAVRASDIRGVSLVIAATDDRRANALVSRAARRQRIGVNVVDQPALSDLISPAIIRAGRAIVAVYTDGKDPVLSRDIKNYLKEQWDDFISYRNRSQKGVA